MNAKQIEKFLRSATGDKNLIVTEPTKKHEGEYSFAVFLNAHDEMQYREKGHDMEEYIIWEEPSIKGALAKQFEPSKMMFGFSYIVNHPGDRETPPDSEMIEYERTETTLQKIVESLARFIFENNLLVAKDNLAASMGEEI